MHSIELTDKELARRRIIRDYNAGKITRSEAAAQLGVSVRRLHGLRRRYSSLGDKGLIDRRRLTKGNFRKPAQVKTQVLTLIRERYPALGPTALCRKLKADHQISVHIATLRLWMNKAGLLTRRRNKVALTDVDPSEIPIANRTATADQAHRRKNSGSPGTPGQPEYDDPILAYAQAQLVPLLDEAAASMTKLVAIMKYLFAHEEVRKFMQQEKAASAG